MIFLGDQGIHQHQEEKKEAPHQQGVHQIKGEVHPKMHQEMHLVQQEMPPGQYQQDLHPVEKILPIGWQSIYGINYFTLQKLWILLEEVLFTWE